MIRIGHVSVRVTDLEAERRHSADGIGLVETHRDEHGATDSKAWDEWDRYGFVLTPADRAGLNHAASQAFTAVHTEPA